MSTDELYLENLDEFVNDENRVVSNFVHFGVIRCIFIKNIY